MSVVCPNCKSDRTQKRNIGTKAVAAVGGTAAGVAAVAGTGAAAAKGAAIGSAFLPGIGTIVGGIAGGVLGFVVGTSAGTAAGAVAGKALDNYVLDSYICLACEHTFDTE